MVAGQCMVWGSGPRLGHSELLVLLLILLRCCVSCLQCVLVVVVRSTRSGEQEQQQHQRLLQIAGAGVVPMHMPKLEGPQD